MSYEIHSPAKRANTSSYGGVVLAFDKEGVARVDQITPALRRWLLAAGYKVRDLDQPDEEPTLFDPAKHTAQEVLAYLAESDQTERARVLEAEQAGKARTSVLGNTDAAGKDTD